MNKCKYKNLCPINAGNEKIVKIIDYEKCDVLSEGSLLSFLSDEESKKDIGVQTQTNTSTKVTSIDNKSYENLSINFVPKILSTFDSLINDGNEISISLNNDIIRNNSNVKKLGTSFSRLSCSKCSNYGLSDLRIHKPTCEKPSFIVCSCSATNFDPNAWYEKYISNHLKSKRNNNISSQIKSKSHKNCCLVEENSILCNSKLKKRYRSPDKKLSKSNYVYWLFNNEKEIEPRCYLLNREKIVKFINKTDNYFKSKVNEIILVCFNDDILILVPWIIKKNKLLIKASKTLTKKSNDICYINESMSECNINVEIPKDYKLNTKCPCNICNIYSKKRNNIIFPRLNLTEEESVITYRPFRVLQHYSEITNYNK